MIKCTGCGARCGAKEWVEIRDTDGRTMKLCLKCTRVAADAPGIEGETRAALLGILEAP
jgi:hypothetical protein